MHSDVIKSDLHSTDTHGYSEVIFGTTHLLGFEFAPRIKALAGSSPAPLRTAISVKPPSDGHIVHRFGVVGVIFLPDSFHLQAQKEPLYHGVDAPMSSRRCRVFQIGQDEWELEVRVKRSSGFLLVHFYRHLGLKKTIVVSF